MAFDTEKKKFSREKMWYCEIVVGGQAYKFCNDITPIPTGLEVDAPSMNIPRITPAKIDLNGGIGVRASLSVSFKEHQDYVRFGTLTNPVRFWPSFRANHQGYQGASIAMYSGYIVGGKFDINNFQRADFVLESFGNNDGGASITGKDVLKLASNDRAKAPRISNGSIQFDITDVATTATLQPAGIGDSEYPASGKGRLGDEVVSFTRTGDALTLVRGQNNTVADSHSAGDLFQLCLVYNDTLSNIIDDILQNYADVDSALIPKTEWDNEADLYLSGNYNAIITEPVGVTDLLKEIGQLGCYFFFDVYSNLIRFVAIKEPPQTALTLTAEDNILEGSTSIADAPDMRISTVIVNFGLFDPTKDLDEVSNYRQGHVRFNTAAITKYNGIEKYKVINSRWISNDNRVAAVRLAAKKGRRFEDIPRMVNFSLDAKDSDVKTGSTAFINSDLAVEATTNARFNMPVQILSATETETKYNYSALEYIYGDALPEDLDSEDPNQRLVVLSGELDQLKDDSGTVRTLRDIYDSLFPDVLSTYNVIFMFDTSCVAGSGDNTGYAVDTGSWPELTVEPPTLDVRGLIVGAGGNGADVGGSATVGGPALILNNNIKLTNTGIIGGGGGGGEDDSNTAGFDAYAAGGGGAGFFNGTAGTGSSKTSSTGFIVPAQDGTNTQGGAGAVVDTGGLEPTVAEGGAGGDLGASGGNGGAAGGIAINTNGYTITYLETGDIRGSIT